MCIVKIPISQANSDNYPFKCMSCLKEDNLVKVRREFIWEPYGKWLNLIPLVLFVLIIIQKENFSPVLFIAFIISMVLTSFTRKKMSLSLFLCPKCNEKYNYPDKLMKKISLMFFIAAFYFFFFNREYVLYAFLTVIVLQNLLYFIVMKKYSLIKLIRIDREYAELELPNDDYCQLYENHMREILNTSSGQCSKCGTENPQSSRFCEKCGASL